MEKNCFVRHLMVKIEINWPLKFYVIDEYGGKDLKDLRFLCWPLFKKPP